MNSDFLELEQALNDTSFANTNADDAYEIAQMQLLVPVDEM